MAAADCMRQKELTSNKAGCAGNTMYWFDMVFQSHHFLKQRQKYRLAKPAKGVWVDVHATVLKGPTHTSPETWWDGIQDSPAMSGISHPFSPSVFESKADGATFIFPLLWFSLNAPAQSIIWTWGSRSRQIRFLGHPHSEDTKKWLIQKCTACIFRNPPSVNRRVLNTIYRKEMISWGFQIFFKIFF